MAAREPPASLFVHLSMSASAPHLQNGELDLSSTWAREMFLFWASLVAMLWLEVNENHR